MRSPPRSGTFLMERTQNADKPAEFTCTKSSSPPGNPQRRLPAAAPQHAADRRAARSAQPCTALPRRLRQGAARPQRAGPDLPQLGAGAGPARAARRRSPNPAGLSGPGTARLPRAALTVPGGARGRAATLTPPPRPCCLAGLRLSRDGGAGRAAEEARGGAAPPRGEKAGTERDEAMRSGGNYRNKH